jgi:hypothetical protein
MVAFQVDRKHGLLPQHVVTNYAWVAHALNIAAADVLSETPHPGMRPDPPLLDSKADGYEHMGFSYMSHIDNLNVEALMVRCAQTVKNAGPAPGISAMSLAARPAGE